MVRHAKHLTDMAQLGFIGLGTMGGRMVSQLLDDGHDVIVFDLDEEAVEERAKEGAQPADSAVSLAERSDVILISLPGPDDVVAVVEEIEAGLSDGDVLVDTTTSTPSTTNAIADELTGAGVDVLGAPVSGGRSGAETGTLSVMIGGDENVFEAQRPVFESVATDIFYIGTRPGHGHAMKLVNNYLSFVAMICTSEAVVMGEQVGLDKETMIDVFNASSGQNTATSYKYPEHIIPEEYDMEYSMQLMEKDMQLLMDVSQNTKTPFMAGGTIRQIIGYIRGELGPDADYTEIYKYFDQVMGDAER